MSSPHLLLCLLLTLAASLTQAQTNAAESRARFYRDFRQALDQADIGWAMWDWKAGFRYWDDAKQQPAPGLREAIFSKAAR